MLLSKGKPVRNDAAAIAMNRFGLGASIATATPADAKAWLRGDLHRFDPRPAPLSALPARSELVQSIQLLQQYKRETRQDRKAEADSADNAAKADAILKDYRQDVRGHYVAAVTARTTIALQSECGFAERLVHFWSNHFAVSIDKVEIVGLAGNFEFEAIRPHIMGRFADLLHAAVRHPAMLLYLDQAQSIGPDSPLAQRVAQRRNTALGLNENLAREILELHTLGVRSVYSQKDVTEFAHALTGNTIAGLGRGPVQKLLFGNSTPGDAVFLDAIHQPGSRSILGESYAQSGAAQGKAIIDALAIHPATARHIATKLARHFVADDPPPALVARLEGNFLETGGDLAALYRTLIDAPESWSFAATKFKSPWEWAISAMRAVGMQDLPVKRPVMVGLMDQMGQPLWKPGSPAGYGDKASDWTGPAGLMRRVEAAGRLARQTAGKIDARTLAPKILFSSLSAMTAEHIARAESPEQGLALLLVSPEFLRR